MQALRPMLSCRVWYWLSRLYWGLARTGASEEAEREWLFSTSRFVSLCSRGINVWYASKSWHNADTATLASVDLSCRSYASTAVNRGLLLLSIEDQMWQGSPECPMQGYVVFYESKVFLGFTQKRTVQTNSRIGKQFPREFIPVWLNFCISACKHVQRLWKLAYSICLILTYGNSHWRQ